MPKAIVDCFDAIEVKHEDCETAIAAFPGCPSRFKVLSETESIAKAGEVIMLGSLSQFPRWVCAR
jgi:hypothetical protein